MIAIILIKYKPIYKVSILGELKLKPKNPAVTNVVLDEIQNVYLADKTPLQVMELVAQWQQELKDKD